MYKVAHKNVYFSLAVTFTKKRKPSIFLQKCFLRSYWKFIEFFGGNHSRIKNVSMHSAAA